MSGRRKKAAAENPSDSFTTLYVALMILLMAFFIVLNSMATISEQRQRRAMASLIGTFGTPHGRNLMSIFNNNYKSDKVEEQIEKKMEKLGARYIPEIVEEVKKFATYRSVAFAVLGNNVEISIDSRVMFLPGEDRLLPEALPLLDKVAKKSLEADRPIMIEGHSDDRPIQSARFPSNWELSTFRAQAVREYLIGPAGVPDYLVAGFGYADSRPIVPNDSEANRARNRRVQITIIGVGNLAKQRGLKTWWERVGFENPFALGTETK